ncbi:hypothetical protein Syun_007117 [Stephania yunnanensis]|uniref:RRM domain-containing protein n=1 Tax=Stephania yunnanensis TaxID=152371 RepID=A0AAP0KY24_9MAGN
MLGSATYLVIWLFHLHVKASRRVQELLLQARESGGTSIIRDHNTNRSRRFGFIVFDHEQVVDDLLANGNMIDMVGTQVSLAKWPLRKISFYGIISLANSYFYCWNTWLVTFGAHSSFRRDERMSLGSYLHDRSHIIYYESMIPTCFPFDLGKKLISRTSSSKINTKN